MIVARSIALLLTALAFLSLSDPAHADTFGSGANTFDIEFVNIGNPGNVADTTGSPNPAGSVPYTYRMGKYEISEQMIDKANSLGGLDITTHTLGPSKPASFITWDEAARFVNWLNTSSGSMPAYKFAVHPGEVGYSADANIELWTISDTGYNPNNLYRNSLAKYFLPNVDEWYKAAYFDPKAGVYYDYPTGSDNVPDGTDFAGDPNYDAVFVDSGSNDPPHDITDVGVLSPYGTAGQGGNLIEWEETAFDLVNDSASEPRGIRGGFYGVPSDWMLATRRDEWDPLTVIDAFGLGFRVASIDIPEPSTLLLGAFASAGVLLWRWL